MPRPHRRVRHLLVVLTLATLAIPVRPIAAQGTSGALPAPINSRQLDRYADRLGLSASQRLAVEALHDEYRREFRALREGEIATFLREQQAVQGGIPQRNVVEDMLEKLDRLHAKIALLDNRLFDQMLPMLAEEQHVVVPRLRLDRERHRYAGNLTAASYGRPTVDLSDLLADRTLDADVAAASDAVMSGYERRLTKTMRKQHDAVLRMSLDMMDILADKGFGEVSQEELLADPALLKEVLGHIQAAFAALRAPTAELADDLRKLNDQTYRQVAAILPADESLRFRNAYYRAAYPQLNSLIALSDTDWMTRALELPDVPEEQRAVLHTLGDQYQRRLTALMEDGIARLDAFWADFSPFEANQERGEQLRADLADLQKQAEEAKVKAQTEAHAQLGETVVETLTKAIAAAETTATASAGTADAGEAGGEAGGEADPAPDFTFSPDRFLPERIDRGDVRRYVRQLQLEDGMAAVLDTIHREYLERLSAMTEFDLLRQARDAVDKEDGAAADTPVAARIERVYALRRQAIAAMVAADAAFFDDLGAIVGDARKPLLDLVRRSRERRACAGSASARLALGRDNSNEAGVDPVSLVLEQQPSEREFVTLADVLAAYEGDALPALRSRLEAQLDLQQRADRWQNEIQAASRQDLSAVIELQQRYREEMKEPTRRVVRTDEVIVELNRRTLEGIAAALSPEGAAAVRHEYELAAFPSIFDDPASIDRHLASALELDDLTAGQRESIVDLGGSYKAEYARLTREMIGYLGTSSVSVVGLDPEGFRDWQQRQQQLAKIRFDRNELNGRAIGRLRSVLSGEQTIRIGGLPEPLGEDDFYFYR